MAKAYSFMLCAVLATSAFGLAGCGNRINSHCDRVCDCQHPTSDRRYEDCFDACVDFTLDVEDEAAAQSDRCLERFDDLMACYDDTGICDERDERYETDCRPEEADLARCLL